VGLSIPSLVEKKLKKLKEKTNDEPCQHHVMINNDAQLIASIIKILILIKPAAPNFGNLRRQNKQHKLKPRNTLKPASNACWTDALRSSFVTRPSKTELFIFASGKHTKDKKKKNHRNPIGSSQDERNRIDLQTKSKISGSFS
jgi:hypothetical protein